MIPPLQVHGAALVLFLVDQGARALRLQLLASSVGHPVTHRDALATNLVGDAACAVTPMRLGGEPSRLGMMLRAGVPAVASFVIIGFEVVTMWPMTIASAIGVGFFLAPGWLEQTAPLLGSGLARNWFGFAVAAVVSVALWLAVRRHVRVTPRVTRRPWRRVRVYQRRMPAWRILASALLGFVNVAARTAILPVLMLALPDPPPLGPAILGSFALLYSQLALPTPSGMGVVDLGLLAGAAGSTGGAGAALLLWWRFYTTLLGAFLGGGIAVREFGWRLFRLSRSTG